MAWAILLVSWVQLSCLMLFLAFRCTRVDGQYEHTLISVRFLPQEEVELFLNTFFQAAWQRG